MKWNWGTKLVIAMALFMAMVIVFVVLMMKEDINLVEKDYYPKGQSFQEQIIKQKNADTISVPIQIERKGDSIILCFPEYFESNKIVGTVHLYHRSEENNDRLVQLSEVNGCFPISISGLKGRYITKIDWVYNDTPYYIEKNLDLN